MQAGSRLARCDRSSGWAYLEQGSAADERRAEGGKALPIKGAPENAMERFWERLAMVCVACRGGLLLIPSAASNVLEYQCQQSRPDGGCVAQQVSADQRAEDGRDGAIPSPAL